MTTWSKNRQELEQMLMGVELTRIRHGRGKPTPELDGLIATIEDEIYYEEQRSKQQATDSAAAFGTGDPEKQELDVMSTVTVGCRATTFRIDGRSVAFGEFRHAAKKHGVDLERRLKLDNKPERFISRGDVRAEP